ncbi:H(+)-transporting V0 sector ATPase subunit d [Coelomomyces lativittatus]|nr:H(+)-transporting V0 sector ATPase subunit d [Coelomomyces lativittatus]
MIDNVILLITGTLHERDTNELLEKCHPLGHFDAMPALCVATTVKELYNMVLVDTPLGPYFKNCLSSHDLDELNIEIIRNTLYKAYLEDFYRFCNEDIGGVTAEVMKDILEVFFSTVALFLFYIYHFKFSASRTHLELYLL